MIDVSAANSRFVWLVWWAALSAGCGSASSPAEPAGGQPATTPADAGAPPPHQPTAPVAADAAPPPDVPALVDRPLGRTISLDSRGFYIDGTPRLLRGGSLQWFRLAEEEWEDRIQRFKAAGFNAIDLYVAWNLHEPTEGKLQFDRPNLPKFLELAKQYNLYVYLRPGPYFTNEWDGGGIPAWVMNKTTKKSLDADGKLNLRTPDPDYLAAVRRYFDALNAVVRPYLVTQGGPVLLYAVENEYNWFELFSKVDKLFWYDGGEERPAFQPLDTTAYFGALRDIVRGGGIDIPIATCPGSGTLEGMGDVTGIVPMPNDYVRFGTETKVTALLASMHDPAQNGGRYVGFPSGFTESDRSASKMKRALLAGMDAYFAFNVAGFHQEGAHNAMIMDQAKALDFSIDAVKHAFVSPTVGLLGSVLDYDGPIGAMGSLRPKFHEFRRANMFFDAFETRIAEVLHAKRSGAGLAGSDPRVAVAHPELGSDESGTRVHTWIDGGDGAYFVGLLNQTGKTQVVRQGSLTIDGLRIPQYTDMTIPPDGVANAGDAPGGTSTAPLGGDTDRDAEPVLVTGLRIAKGLRLRYTTSETLTLREFNGHKLLVVYGPAGADGELALDELAGAATFVARSSGVQIAAQSDRSLAVRYAYGAPQFLSLRTVGGDTLDVVITDTDLAGRFWFLRADGEDLAIAGLDYVSSAFAAGRRVRLAYEHRAPSIETLVLSRAPFALDGFEARTAFDPATGSASFAAANGQPLPAPATLLNAGKRVEDTSEALPGDPFVASIGWSGDPRSVEALGVDGAHVWYRAEVDLPAKPPAGRTRNVHLDHASDFVSIYANGKYVTTVTPLGTEVDVDVAPHLVAGRNVLAFRVGVWGHGSFMWPRGTLIPTKAAAPSVGYDAVKGVWGAAYLGGDRLTRWSVRGGLGGEGKGYAKSAFDDAAWPAATGTPTLAAGEVAWYRWRVRSGQLPDPAKLFAPMGLDLRGSNVFATVYVNGRLIGRWVSDDEWAGRGFWGRVTRTIWSVADADQVPIAREILAPGNGENVITIAFEDMSSGASGGARIDDVKLAPVAEGRVARGGVLERAPLFANRRNAVLH